MYHHLKRYHNKKNKIVIFKLVLHFKYSKSLLPLILNLKHETPIFFCSYLNFKFNFILIYPNLKIASILLKVVQAH